MATALVTLLDARDLIGAASDDRWLAAFTHHLGPDEQARLPAFVRPQRRREFVLGRLLLRLGVQAVVPGMMDGIDIIECAGAGPRVEGAGGAGREIGVSVSHSRGWIACAVGTNGPLGIDIEASANTGRDLAALAQASFSQGERHWLASQSDQDQAFYRLWCAKEALYKFGCNAGLSVSDELPQLDCADVNMAPGMADDSLMLVELTLPGRHLALCGLHALEITVQEIPFTDLSKKFTIRDK